MSTSRFASNFQANVRCRIASCPPSWLEPRASLTEDGDRRVISLYIVPLDTACKPVLAQLVVGGLFRSRAKDRPADRDPYEQHEVERDRECGRCEEGDVRSMRRCTCACVCVTWRRT